MPSPTAKAALSSMRRILRRVEVVLYPLLTIVAVLVGWELWIKIGDVKLYIAPPPTDVFEALYTDAGTLFSNAWATLQEILIGFGLAIAIGLLVAALMVALDPMEKALRPLLVVSQVIPIVALAPILLIWFGFGNLPRVLLVFLISFFPIAIDSSTGMRSIEIEKLYLARSMGASPLKTFTSIRFPAALPSIFSGLKVAATLSVVGAVVSEFVASRSGLGHLLITANVDFDTVTVFAAVFYLAAIGFLIFSAVALLERVLTPWHVSRRLDVAAQ